MYEREREAKLMRERQRKKERGKNPIETDAGSKERSKR